MDNAENEVQVADRGLGKWYVLQVRVSFERKVQRTIMANIQNNSEPVPIYEALVPEQKYLEKDSKRKDGESRGKSKKEKTKLIYPGYVYVRMDLYKDDAMTVMNEKVWYFLRSINGVTRFSGNPEHPLPLSDSEVSDLEKIIEKFNEEATTLAPPNWLNVGIRVRVDDPDCPFNDMIGRVVELDQDNSKVKLMIKIFERDTPVELEFKQVALTSV